MNMKKLLYTLSFCFLTAVCYAQQPTTIKLTQLETSKTVESTKAGQIGLTNTSGKQRYAQYTEIELTAVAYVPAATGNTLNISEFVIGSDGNSYYIDWQGRGLKLSVSGPTDKNGYYGGNLGNGGDQTIPSVTKSTLTNQLTFYRATDNLGGLVPVRIEVAAGNEPDFMSFKNLTDSLVIKRSDQDFEIKCTNGLSIYGNTSATGGNGGISMFADNADIVAIADNAMTINANNGGIDIAASDAIALLSNNSFIDLTAETNISMLANTGNITFLISGAASNYTITDNSTVKRGLEYAADYCTAIKVNNLSIPSVLCVNALIHDSLSSHVLPPGTINQTLRYSATNVISATSQLMNNNSTVSIGTTTLPSRYDLYILGETWGNGKGKFGNAITKGRGNATFSVEDSIGAIPCILNLANKWNAIHSDAELYIQSRHASAASLAHWMNSSLETGFHVGTGDGFNSLRFCANQDSSISNGLAMSIGPAKHVGFWVDNKTDGQANFQAQDDEGTIPPPIALTMGDVPDTKVDGTFMYYDGLEDELGFVIGSELTDVLTGFQKNNAVIDFAATNFLTTSTADVTVAGATPGDGCVLGAPTAVQCDGCQFTCQVSAANTVHCMLTYVATAGAVNPASDTYQIKVIR